MASPLAEILLSMAPVPGMKKGAMPPRVENPIRAYHGSPHDFDKFDLSKIGTGEGAQAYGHGLYFAENEGVAKSYREGLSKWRPHIDGVPVMDLWAEGKLPQKMAEVAGLNRVDSISASNWVTDAVRTGRPLQEVLAEKIETARRIYPPELAEPEIASIKAVGEKIMPFAPEVSKGHTYEVAIHASPDQFLDWDKPLSQQSEAVRTALNKKIEDLQASGQPMMHSYVDALKKDRLNGAQIFSGLGRGTPESASKAWSDVGVPGIRYLDQGSRNATPVNLGKYEAKVTRLQDALRQNPTEANRFALDDAIQELASMKRRAAETNTSNYVVFDPALIEILRKYGLLGPVAAGATANALMGDKDSQ